MLYRNRIIDDTKPAPSADLVGRLEDSLGAGLPADYLEFITTCNGGHAPYEIDVKFDDGTCEPLSFCALYTFSSPGSWETLPFELDEDGGVRKAKLAGKPVKQLVAREIGHWCTLLAFIGIVLLLERKEIIDRESTSDISLMLLALTCCLAGIHFDWLLTVIGVVLTIMLVALATLEQYTLVLWVVMILVSAGAIAFLYFRAKNRPESENEPLE